MDDAVDSRKERILTTWAVPILAKGNPAIIEAHAIRLALLKAMEEHWTSILILSDCKMLIKYINSCNEDLSNLDIIVRDIKLLYPPFWRCSFSLVNTEGNTCSHALA